MLSIQARALAVALLSLLLLPVGLFATDTAIDGCTCGGVKPSPVAQCLAGYSDSAVVIRGYVKAMKLQESQAMYTITVRAVYYNSANSPLVTDQDIYIYTTSSSGACGTFLTYHREYYLRARLVRTIYFQMSKCDYRELVSAAVASPAQLSCGRSLSQCDIYPCGPDRPCSESSVVCPAGPGTCPQRVCGGSTGCSNVVCPKLSCTNSVIVGCCRQCGSASSLATPVALIVSMLALALGGAAALA